MNIADFDIREYLQAMHVQYWENGVNVSKGWVGTQCMYCDDHHNHLGIHLYYKNYSCWKCEAKGNLIQFIIDLENISYRTALQRIDEYQSDTPLELQERERLTPTNGNILPYGCTPNLSTRQNKWLQGRRYTPTVIQAKWGIIAGPLTGNWAHRIICPVRSKGKTMSWVGIDTTGTQYAKYKAAPVEKSFLPVSELLYGVDYVQKNAVLIVEGMLDAWRMGLGTVATFGMGVGNWKIHTLAELNTNQYFIMFDSEPLAITKAKELGSVLKHTTGRHVELLELPQGDPDDLDDQTATDLRKEIGLI